MSLAPDNSDELVTVTLTMPRHVYPSIVRLLADSIDGMHPGTATDGTADEAASWTSANFRQFITTGTRTNRLIGDVMDVLATRPGTWVSTTELVEAIEVERNALRAALGAFTRHLKRHYDGRAWPFVVQWGPDHGRETEMYYQIDDTVAALWREARDDEA